MSQAANMEVATTILNQLGGRKFIAMTGVKNLVADTNNLTMRLTRNKINAKWMRVTLNGLDLYDVEFITESKGAIKNLATIENVYCDQLQEIFTEKTGLYTRL